jgi:enamine deaminase RidA (YjgF/YER057c/UK114 family)
MSQTRWSAVMTTESTPSSSTIEQEAVASRRDFVAVAVTVAATAGAAGTVAPTQAQAQTANVRFMNPPGMSQPAYSHVVEVNGPHRVIYLSGQTPADPNAKVATTFRAQALQVFENIKMALAGVGATFENVVKTTTYLTNMPVQLPQLREIRDMYLNKAAPPTSTTVQVAALANPAYLIEVEVMAVLPPRA